MVYRISEASIRRAWIPAEPPASCTRLFAAALQNACAARVDVPHRRRCTPARAAAGRHRRARSCGARTRRCWRRPSRRPPPSSWRCGCSRRRSRCHRPRSPRCSPRCARQASRPRPRTRPARSSTSAPAAPGCPHRRVAASTARCRARPARRCKRDRRGAAQGGRHAVRHHAARPGRGDHPAAAGRASPDLGGDRLCRPGRGGHPAGGGADQCPRRPADRLRSGLGPGARVRHPPRHVGGVGRRSG